MAKLTSSKQEIAPQTRPADGLADLTDLRGLPALMLEIAEVAGLEAAITICDRYGGNRVYIPRYPRDDHWLVQCVGSVAAIAICRHFASPSGIELELPTGVMLDKKQRRARLEKLIAAGFNSTEITRRLGITRRSVKRARAQIRQLRGAAQMDLFLPAPDKAD